MTPTLPPEEQFGDLELDMFENEPPGLFPENQDSYWGQPRKIYADYLTKNILAAFDQWYLNLDPNTVNEDDIGEWEFELGVPTPRTDTLEQRRALVRSRQVYGATTIPRLNAIVEGFINAGMTGMPLRLYPKGIPLTAGGLKLFPEQGLVTDRYRIYFDQWEYRYYVWIRNTVSGVDTGSLTRELTRLTPAGYEVFVDTAKAQILDYHKDVLHDGPSVWYTMDAISLPNFVDDFSGAGLIGTANGGLAAGGAAILDGTVGAGTSMDFDGVNDYISRASAESIQPLYSLGIEIWVKPDVVNAQRGIANKGGASGWVLYSDNTGKVKFEVSMAGVLRSVTSLTSMTVGGVYHIFVRVSNSGVDLFINGVKEASFAIATGLGILDSNASALQVGQATGAFFDGKMDEFALYSHPISDARILHHYRTGTNVL